MRKSDFPIFYIDEEMKTRIQLPELFPSITIAHSFKKVSLLCNTDDAINVFRAGNIFKTLNDFLFFTIHLRYLILQFQIYIYNIISGDF